MRAVRNRVAGGHSRRAGTGRRAGSPEMPAQTLTCFTRLSVYHKWINPWPPASPCCLVVRSPSVWAYALVGPDIRVRRPTGQHRSCCLGVKRSEVQILSARLDGHLRPATQPRRLTSHGCSSGAPSAVPANIRGVGAVARSLPSILHQGIRYSRSAGGCAWRHGDVSADAPSTTAPSVALLAIVSVGRPSRTRSITRGLRSHPSCDRATPVTPARLRLPSRVRW